MSETRTQRVQISQADLTACARLVDARYDDVVVEAARVQIVRELLGAAAAVEHAIRIQTRCALVNHFGTRGTRDLGEATDALFDAMLAHASVIRQIGARFHHDDPSGVRVPRLEVV